MSLVMGDVHTFPHPASMSRYILDSDEMCCLDGEYLQSCVCVALPI